MCCEDVVALSKGSADVLNVDVKSDVNLIVDGGFVDVTSVDAEGVAVDVGRCEIVVSFS